MTSGPVSFPRRIRDLAAEVPDQVALRFVSVSPHTETVLDWAELDAHSTEVAHSLSARGLGLGDRVAVELRNSPELVAVILGAWKCGGVPVPVRWDLPDWERSRVLDVVGAKVVVSTPFWQRSAQDLELSAARTDVVPPQTHGICSSGSTGTPKVILVDRPGVWDPAASDPFPSGWMSVARPQTVLVPAPLYHTNGFATLFSLLAGDELVLMERFDAARLVELIERYRVTTFTATPTMLQRIADLPDIAERDLSSLVWVLQGGAVIAPTLVRRWLDLVGPEHFFLAYGMTEGLGLTALRGDEWLEHPGSVGRGYRDTEVRIRDEAGVDLPAGEIGEIYLRSPTSGLYRYLGADDSLTTTDDGFSTASDMGFLDDGGFLHILDRRVDMVITGGANVFPAEVENALIDHPAIADVVVIGLPDPEWGRRVHAVVEPADPAAPPKPDDVVAFAKSRLAPYKVPKSVEIVDKMPRSEATKISRAALVAERLT